MAVPKKKRSVSRNGMRYSHVKVSVINLSKCSHCGELKQSHHICSACGYYKNQKVMVTRAEKRLNKQDDTANL